MVFDYARSLQISQEELDEWLNRINKINNKLSDYYYEQRLRKTLLVGSVGRGTAIIKTSDYDVIFVLPQEAYIRFDSYETNGQSALLQEVKGIISELYPRTEIKADGQVVDVFFDDGKIELVPVFKQPDGSFKFPDSHDGGKWKITKPVPEIEKATSLDNSSSGIYSCLCRLIRQWKNYVGFSFKGLLIDTMVCNYLESNENYTDKSELDILKGLFEYLSREDKNKSYWLALGSNQQINNNDNGKFIYKASQALKKINDSNGEEELLRELFGYNQFKNKAPDEEFIENKFSIDIRYDMSIDCVITQNGFLPRRLSEYLQSRLRITKNRSLMFEIVSSSIPRDLPVKYYWKVRNVGPHSVGRERGEIFKGEEKQKEHSDFTGSHYVECYAVLNNIVVARDRIDVPIDIENGV